MNNMPLVQEEGEVEVTISDKGTGESYTFSQGNYYLQYLLYNELTSGIFMTFLSNVDIIIITNAVKTLVGRCIFWTFLQTITIHTKIITTGSV